MNRIELLEYLCGAMYQAAGAYDMPERFLDVLLAAGDGDEFTREQVDALLPVESPALRAGVPEVSEQDLIVFAEAHGNPDPAVREIYRSGLEAYRARLMGKSDD